MPNERSPLIQSVPVADQRDRYPHRTVHCDVQSRCKGILLIESLRFAGSAQLVSAPFYLSPSLPYLSMLVSLVTTTLSTMAAKQKFRLSTKKARFLINYGQRQRESAIVH